MEAHLKWVGRMCRYRPPIPAELIGEPGFARAKDRSPLRPHPSLPRAQDAGSERRWDGGGPGPADERESGPHVAARMSDLLCKKLVGLR
jgi:hypothetical protein